MSADKELLKLAARAAGLKIDRWHGDCGDFWEAGAAMWRRWSPLTDDGDALRLAVKLDIVPRSINGAAFAWCDGICDMHEPHNGDPCAATRRAIVRAAAEIGRQMP